MIYEGLNINVTLLFGVEEYAQVAEAFLKGLERRVADGETDLSMASVASFFVSRVDTEVDKRLDGTSPRGAQGQGRPGERPRRLHALQGDLLRRALGEARGGRRARAAPAVGVDRREGPGLPRHALRRRADRAAHGQHDADGDAARRRRPRRGQRRHRRQRPRGGAAGARRRRHRPQGGHRQAAQGRRRQVRRPDGGAAEGHRREAPGRHDVAPERRPRDPARRASSRRSPRA